MKRRSICFTFHFSNTQDRMVTVGYKIITIHQTMGNAVDQCLMLPDAKLSDIARWHFASSGEEQFNFILESFSHFIFRKSCNINLKLDLLLNNVDKPI